MEVSEDYTPVELRKFDPLIAEALNSVNPDHAPRLPFGPEGRDLGLTIGRRTLRWIAAAYAYRYNNQFELVTRLRDWSFVKFEAEVERARCLLESGEYPLVTESWRIVASRRHVTIEAMMASILPSSDGEEENDEEEQEEEDIPLDGLTES